MMPEQVAVTTCKIEESILAPANMFAACIRPNTNPVAMTTHGISDFFFICLIRYEAGSPLNIVSSTVPATQAIRTECNVGGAKFVFRMREVITSGKSHIITMIKPIMIHLPRLIVLRVPSYSG